MRFRPSTNSEFDRVKNSEIDVLIVSIRHPETVQTSTFLIIFYSFKHPIWKGQYMRHLRWSPMLTIESVCWQEIIYSQAWLDNWSHERSSPSQSDHSRPKSFTRIAFHYNLSHSLDPQWGVDEQGLRSGIYEPYSFFPRTLLIPSPGASSSRRRPFSQWPTRRRRFWAKIHVRPSFPRI